MYLVCLSCSSFITVSCYITYLVAPHIYSDVMLVSVQVCVGFALFSLDVLLIVVLVSFQSGLLF